MQVSVINPLNSHPCGVKCQSVSLHIVQCGALEAAGDEFNSSLCVKNHKPKLPASETT